MLDKNTLDKNHFKLHENAKEAAGIYKPYFKLASGQQNNC